VTILAVYTAKQSNYMECYAYNYLNLETVWQTVLSGVQYLKLNLL